MQRSQVNSPSWVMENSEYQDQGLISSRYENPIPTSRRQNNEIRQTLWSQLAGAVGTKTRSQTRRPLGEPRVGKRGWYSWGCCTVPQENWVNGASWPQSNTLSLLEIRRIFTLFESLAHTLQPSLCDNSGARDIILLLTRVKIVLPPT